MAGPSCPRRRRARERSERRRRRRLASLARRRARSPSPLWRSSPPSSSARLVIVFSDPDTLEAWSEFFSDPVGRALGVVGRRVRRLLRAVRLVARTAPTPISRTLVEATPLLFAGLSVALAFRAGLFNIGAAGQLMMGATAAAYVGFNFDLPAVIHLPLALAAGFAGGMVVGRHRRVPQGPDRRPRGDLARSCSTSSPSSCSTTSSASRRFQRPGPRRPDHPAGADESARLPELPGPFDVHAGAPAGPGGRRRRVVAARALDGRLPDARRRHQPATRPGRGHERRRARTCWRWRSPAGSPGWPAPSNLLGRPSYSLTGGFYAEIGFDAIALALVGRSKPGGVVGRRVALRRPEGRVDRDAGGHRHARSTSSW